jgi:hypothetical protein
VKADWIDGCIDAARQAIGEVDPVAAERLKVAMETQLSIRALRPKELRDLADELMGLPSVDSLTSDMDSTHADQSDPS